MKCYTILDQHCYLLMDNIAGSFMLGQEVEICGYEWS